MLRSAPLRVPYVLVAAICVLAPAPAAAYRTLADVEASRLPIVWLEPARVAFSPSVAAGAAERGLIDAELDAALRTWGALACMRPMLVPSSLDTATVRVGFVDDWAARGFAVDAAGVTDVALATDRDGGAVITGAFIHLNAGFDWGAHPQDGTDGFRDLRALLVHELGHVLGLAHPCEPDEVGLACTPEHEDSAMHPIYRGSEQARLAADDVEGACALYPALAPAVVAPAEEASRCERDDECSPGEWCLDDACRRDLRYGGPCDRPQDCIGARCLAGEARGTCTYACDADGECPAGTRCAPVGGAEERVCAPHAASCAVASGRGGAAPWWLAWAPLVLVLRRRRAPVAFVALAAGLFVGCDGDVAGLDAGVGAEAGAIVDAARVVDADGIDGGARDGGAPDAGLDASPERCDSPGATRIAPCGLCGMGSEECADSGYWEPVSACLGQGECRAGAVETEALGLCGERQRLCVATCEWTAWETTVPSDGDCTPGDLRRDEASCAPGLAEEQRCSDRCRWETTSACSDPCGGMARTSPLDQQEVCVPAGPFIRGSERIHDAMPVAEVYVSSFYIDRYPVTNDRYRACVDAGHCSRPFIGRANIDSYDSATRGRYPFQGATHDWARSFCDWDGGRRLPTEAEWEKAARGPTPRAQLYLWDEDEFRCDLLLGGNCPGSPRLSTLTAVFAIDALPGTRSYYGTYLQLGGVFEWASDYFDLRYYADPASLIDPTGPPPPMGGVTQYYVARGAPADRLPTTLGSPLGVSSRGRRGHGDIHDAPVGIRCARSAP